MKQNYSGLYLILSSLTFLLLSSSGCRAVSDNQPDYDALRQRMIHDQIMARGITDKRILRAFDKVERHLFVDSALMHEAYNDYPLPIDEGQTISQPYIVAVMTDMLELEKDDKVLEIGTGSGYQAAILAEMVDSVFSVEIVESLGLSAQTRLHDLGYGNIFIKIGDGYRGWPEHAPFDAIIVTCAPEEIPQPLIDQLTDGGRMIIPIGGFLQELVLLKKEDGKLSKKIIAPVQFVPMTGESQKGE
jgi:protein-L-isoaspartate(D-aspartate) O-methyltransferase